MRVRDDGRRRGRGREESPSRAVMSTKGMREERQGRADGSRNQVGGYGADPGWAQLTRQALDMQNEAVEIGKRVSARARPNSPQGIQAMEKYSLEKVGLALSASLTRQDVAGHIKKEVRVDGKVAPNMACSLTRRTGRRGIA